MNEFILRLDRGARALLRLLTLRPCSFCGKRVKCWRWHVEYFTCPTCKRSVSEFDEPAASHVVRALADDIGCQVTVTGPPGLFMYPTTTSTGVTTTWRFE